MLISFSSKTNNNFSSRELTIKGVGTYTFSTASEKKRVVKALKAGLCLNQALQCWNPARYEELVSSKKCNINKKKPDLITNNEECKSPQITETSVDVSALINHFARKGKVNVKQQRMNDAATDLEQEYRDELTSSSCSVETKVELDADGIPLNVPESFRYLWKATLVKMRENAAYQKWLRKELPWQQMLVLFKAQTGIDLLWVTQKEWETKTVTKKHMKQFGLKSPKLSKAFKAMGVNQKQISTLMSTTTKEQTVTYVTGEKEAAEEQGNSIHYSSCQATDSRSVWGSDSTYCKVDEDLQVVGTELFFWVVGESMKRNSEGYKARAKLRLVYEDPDCNKIGGLYIDRPYGQHKLLIDNINQLEEWWESFCCEKGWSKLPIFLPPVWQRDNGAGNNFERLYGNRSNKGYYVPSAEYGYQDTLSAGYIGEYTFFVPLNTQQNLLTAAYKARTKIGGVYMSALTEVEYNPQKGISAPVITLPEWKNWNAEDYEFFNGLYQMLGIRPKNAMRWEYPEMVWRFDHNGISYEAWKDPHDDEHVAFHQLDDVTNDVRLWKYNGNPFNMQERLGHLDPKEDGFYVLKDIPALGYQKALMIPYNYSPEGGYHVNPNYVTKELYDIGFASAEYIGDWFISDGNSLTIQKVNQAQIEAGFCPAWHLSDYEESRSILSKWDWEIVEEYNLEVFHFSGSFPKFRFKELMKVI